MTEAAKIGGPGRGQGRKPKDAAGHVMRVHTMRWTDDQWADVLLIGMDRVRELVTIEAARQKTGESH